MRVRACGCLWALLVACGNEPAEDFVAWSVDESVLEFFVLFHEQRPAGVWGRRELEAGAVRVTREADDELIRVSVPKASLAGIDPLLDPTALEGLELRPRTPCPDCGSMCIEANSTRLSVPLPEAAEHATLIGQSFSIAPPELIDRVQKQTRLELERSADDCTWRSEHPIRPFGTEDDLQDGVDEGSRVIDADRLLLSNSKQIMLGLRGRDRGDNERRVLTAASLGHALFGGSGLISTTSTSVRFLLVARTAEGINPAESTIYEIEGTEERLRVVSERARVPGILLPVTSTGDGGFAAAGERGLVVISGPDTPTTSFTLGEGFRLTALHHSDPELGHYHVGGSFGFVAEGDVFAGPGAMRLASLARGEGFVDSSVIGFRRRALPEGDELWAITRGQGVFRRTSPGTWEPADFEAPPGADICVLMPDACGRARLMEINEGLEFAPDGRLFYTPWMCAALFTRRPGDPCTQSVELGDLPSGTSGTITTVRSGANTLFFVRNRSIWTLEL